MAACSRLFVPDLLSGFARAGIARGGRGDGEVELIGGTRTRLRRAGMSRT